MTLILISTGGILSQINLKQLLQSGQSENLFDLLLAMKKTFYHQLLKTLNQITVIEMIEFSVKMNPFSL